MDKTIAQRNKQRVEDTFRVLDLMEDVRDIWRDAAPLQNLSEESRAALTKKIEKARKALDRIEASL
ncbi:MAG TPA: hypothetical protein PLK80_09655 [bacterium]|nr:MAG: hypothetical protein BWY28_03094 [bacterium ADurb.Bin236]HOC93030.1 hypothetical protein [bacterium]HOY63161.1 hypothetical protein [bacterium]HPI76988.1 hypothetical protein [bacterium]HPN93090.1 hypothetical protein [bacterium]